MGFLTKDKPFLLPDTQAFIDNLAARDTPPLNTLTCKQARKVLEEAQSLSCDMPEADIRDLDLSIGPTSQISVRIVRLCNLKGKTPFVLYIHGGGWVMGNKHTHERLIRDLAVGSDTVLIFPDHTPSPEVRYPIAIEQTCAVLVHMTKHVVEYDLDPSRVAVAGDSVGGNMAAVIAILVKKRNARNWSFRCCYIQLQTPILLLTPMSCLCPGLG